ncbi:MAG: mitochondrial fission ELM1 family protein [Proteobacteria bacterium]|nr:mitochondrial fission ELM1 family protein [Pseudomonadota bacterium]MBS0464383.1 mitochondrial fission ELM1 family protein [Pseudomonadota bacterium]
MTPAIWVVTDGAAGNERQALALATALSASDAPEPQLWRLHARAPWQHAAPRLLPASERAFGDAFRMALVQPPRFAIGCGRQGALATRLLRAAGARTLQILDPRIDLRHWDVVVAPEHDGLRGENIVSVRGSLHPVDAIWLHAARARFPQLGELPAPRTALLLGGPIGNVPLDRRWCTEVIQALRSIHAREGGSVSVCASRRTPAWLCDELCAGLGGIDGLRWRDARDGDNPYAGLLAWAQRIVVSPDTVNMLSEAAATGADVRVARPQVARGKHAAFIASLLQAGAARVLADDPIAPTTELRELPRVAAAVRERLGMGSPVPHLR